MRANLLVVEDNEDMCKTLADVLRKQGYTVFTAFSGEAALKQLQQRVIDLVLLDIKLPDGISGLDVLKEIKEMDPDILAIMITAVSDARIAIDALKRGAYDYLMKPFELDELKLVVAKALETHQLKREVARLRIQQKTLYPGNEIFGNSPKIQDVRKMIKIVSQTPKTSVLIQGESGTGKELVTNAIHNWSARRDKPLVKINCAAIPENLLESELFGHERGAFTDAKSLKKGIFELAHGGTLFLDEISSMQISLQPKLLRVLETQSFRRIGGTADLTIDVRVVAATNRDLDECMRDGTFREDLLYRLKVLTIDLPPLRERREDVMPLAKLFLETNNADFSKSIRSFSPDVEELLINYRWPGNIRELKNVIERAVILCSDDVILPEHLPLELQSSKPMIPTSEVMADASGNGAGLSLQDMERRHIMHTLKEFDGNKSKTARILNISRSTLREKLKLYGI